ncbi:MAG: hypothetical protein II404_10045 [Prevotella sp.]|nr:hypothetical protein [Prevotella sp.]
MKKQIMTLMVVLLTCSTAIALATLPGIHALVYYKATIVIAPEGAGTVNPMEYAKVLSGQTRSFTATANAGYSLEGWYIDGQLVATDNPYSHKFTADVTITAKFKEEPANTVLGFIKAGCEGMGTVSVNPEGTAVEGGYKFTHGTSVTLKASPAKGHEFVRWEDANGNSLSTNAAYSFTINEDCAVYAVFKVMENYHADLISFPGCEGWGRFTTGGRAVDSRGSKVYYVTRLDDSNAEGTLRWACTTGDDTPRTVLFKVAGTIYLNSNLTTKANTTIAGQTAPAGGICIAGYRFKLSSNTILRYLRFRAGDLPNGSMSPLGVENVQNIVIDHCSFGWSMEENITLYDNKYTTTQWCIFSESLYYSKNVKGHRAYGAQWGGERSTMHHCLFAHNQSRSPRFNGVRTENHDRQAVNEFVNNVVFNWGSKNAIYGGENYITDTGEEPEGAAPHYNRVYMINNYYRPGPATKEAMSSQRYFVCPSGNNINMVGQWYLSGNKFELSSKWAPSSNIWKDEELLKVYNDNYYGFVSENPSRAINPYRMSPSQELADKMFLKEPVAGDLTYSNYETADAAFQSVVTKAGASLPRYDEVDTRVLAEAAGTIDPQYGGQRGSKLGIIDSPNTIALQSHDEFVALDEATGQEIDVTCYPRLQMDSYDCGVLDTDGDGLPDAYETEVGLNPNDPSDGPKLSASGYSNLELFLNGVADGQIDAKQYTQRQPVAKMNGFNAVVGEGEAYQTIQAAIDAAPNDATPNYIFVKKGTYEGHVQINRQNVHLMGQSRDNTIISWNKIAAEGNVDNTSTINVTANDVSFDNLTIRNTRTNEGQALALYTKADRIIITNCNLEGWQDTYRTGKDGHRHLVRNSKVSGTTDFIYGAGEAFFDDVTLHVLRTSNVIVAPDHISPKYGYVFRNATITAAQSGSTTALGRPWGNTPKVAFINTQLTSGVSITAQGWNDMDGLPSQMAEYNTMDANGNTVDLSQRKTSFTNDAGTTKTSKAVLTPKEADSHKLDYMLRGSDNWDADWQGFILPAPTLSVSGHTVSWSDATGYAQSYLVIVDGVASITTDTSVNSGGKLVTVQCVSAYGVAGEIASSADPTAISHSRSDVQVVSRQYFTPDGRQVHRLQHGLNIIRETLADGTLRTTKIMAK